DYWDYFHSQQVNSMNQEAGTKHMKSRLSTPQAYVSSSVCMFEFGTVGLSDHVVRSEVADMVQKHTQIAVSRGSMFRLLQNAHIQAFENPSATVSAIPEVKARKMAPMNVVDDKNLTKTLVTSQIQKRCKFASDCTCPPKWTPYCIEGCSCGFMFANGIRDNRAHEAQSNVLSIDLDPRATCEAPSDCP
nr:hypothetical protein [Tanacetum cinerariifolium]